MHKQLEVNMNEIILIILGCLLLGFFLWREDKKKKEQELSDRLYQAENNITYLNNVNYKIKKHKKKKNKQLSFNF